MCCDSLGPLALPVIGNLYLLGTHPHRKLQSLANKYGPIVSLWLGQVPAIVVSSPEAALNYSSRLMTLLSLAAQPTKPPITSFMAAKGWLSLSMAHIGVELLILLILCHACLAPFDLHGLTRRIKETAKGLDQMLEKIIKEHEHANKKNGKQEDFIHMLLSLLAHQDTDGVLSELLRNPKVMKNHQDEIQKVVGINRMVEETDLVNLNYLDVVIKESLRLYPSGPFVPRESVEDVMVNGYYIQKKSRILINAWAIGRDPKICSDNAHEFYPERFLNNNEEFQGNNFLLVAFGAGRRKCPGLQWL
ncbi:hypothetical protein K1719_033775 [Acacia pycnantha]|nr:hypothetical protein K1719_033775 [Acacia pycnantha]